MREMIRLALPVVLGQLGMMSLGLVDLLAVADLGAAATGAVGLGSSFFAWGMVAGMGLLSSMDHLIAKAYTQKEFGLAMRYLDQAVWISLLVSVPVMLVLWLVVQNLTLFHIGADIAEPTRAYTEIILWSLPPALVFTAYRNFLQAVGIAVRPMLVLLAAIALNAILNYALIYGWWGLPAMGTPGTAVATLICRLWMAGMCYLFLRGWIRANLTQEVRKRSRRFSWNYAKPFLHLGLPSSGQMLLEVGIFSLTTALAATISAPAVAAHQIVLNISSLCFMVPLGIGSATAILVSRAVGRNDAAGAKKMGQAGLLLGTGFMFCSGMVLLSIAGPILGLYSKDQEVITLALQIVFVAGLFQLSDGVQTVSTGALRGLADTRTPMWSNLVGHWMIGLPIGSLLCFHLGWGLRGLWTGLAIGLTFVALVLIVSWYRQSSPAFLRRRIAVLAEHAG